ncbi:hypothetical protein TPA0905_04220 [Streptomyces olivaceus]|nr:hypothetical protein TPA0905_04220 [Streptomyces olivaceus]
MDPPPWSGTNGCPYRHPMLVHHTRDRSRPDAHRIHKAAPQPLPGSTGLTWSAAEVKPSTTRLTDAI